MFPASAILVYVVSIGESMKKICCDENFIFLYHTNGEDQQILRGKEIVSLCSCHWLQPTALENNLWLIEVFYISFPLNAGTFQVISSSPQ